MYYNFKRFGNPFDFGANYNQTTNDMTHRGFVFDRFFPGICEYLIQPPQFSPSFPYLQPINFETENIDYIGITIMEDCYGGYLWLCPAFLIVAVMFFKKLRNKLKLHPKYTEILQTVLICTTLGVVLILIDIQVAGILFRYFLDFGMFFSIASTLILGVLLEKRIKASKPTQNVYDTKALNSSTLIIHQDRRLAKKTNYFAYGVTIYTIIIWAFIVMQSIFVYNP